MARLEGGRHPGIAWPRLAAFDNAILGMDVPGDARKISLARDGLAKKKQGVDPCTRQIDFHRSLLPCSLCQGAPVTALLFIRGAAGPAHNSPNSS